MAQGLEQIDPLVFDEHITDNWHNLKKDKKNGASTAVLGFDGTAGNCIVCGTEHDHTSTGHRH